MKKKILLIVALILVVGGIVGGWWYMNRPVPLAEEPEDDAIAVNTEPEEVPEPESTPEPEETPEAGPAPDEEVDPYTLTGDELTAYLSQLSEEELKAYVEGLDQWLDGQIEKVTAELGGNISQESQEPEISKQPEESQPAAPDNVGEQGRELTTDEIRQKIANHQTLTREEVDRLLDEAGISHSWGEDMPRIETRPDDVRLDPNYVPPRIYW